MMGDSDQVWEEHDARMENLQKPCQKRSRSPDMAHLGGAIAEFEGLKRCS